MSTTPPRSPLCLLAFSLVLALAGTASAEWRYTCPKCGRDLGQAVGASPNRCGCGWRQGDRVPGQNGGGGFDLCIMFSCMGGVTLIVGFVILAVKIIPPLVMGGPPKRRRRRRRREDADDF